MFKQRRYVSVVAVILAILMTGCFPNIPVSYSEQGTPPLNTGLVAKIKKGKTTKSEVETMFGIPQSVSLTGGGSRTVTYSSSQTKGTGRLGYIENGRTYSQSLQVMYDQNLVVTDYVFSTTSYP